MITWRHLIEKTSVFGCCLDEKSKYVILGIPLDQSTTYKPGTRFAPERIRLAACNIEFYSLINERTLDDLCFNDLGDVVITPGDLFKTLENTTHVVKGIFNEYSDKTLFFLGGEHTITYAIVKALYNEIDELIVFDAHLDLRDEYLGSKYNHATVMRRIYEEFNTPITYIGARAFSSEELEFIKSREEIKVYTPREIDLLKREISFERVYISIDLDVVDPAYAPGVSNPEPLGITSQTLLEILHVVLKSSKRIIGFDLVEVNPLVDVNDITSILASKIIVEIIGFLESR